MRTFIINPLYSHPVEGLSADELQNLFSVYHHTNNNISEENLRSFTSNIAISFGDFIFRIGNNIKANIGGMFKQFKRSELKIAIDSNKLSLQKIFQSDYSTLCQFSYPQYPFNFSPKEVMKFMDEYFVRFDMLKRMENLIHEYSMFASYIEVSDMASAESVIKRIQSMNLRSYNEVTNYQRRAIALPNGKDVSFGKIFNSVTEFREAVDVVMTHADELEKALKVGSLLDKLYDALVRIQKSILKAKEKNIDFGRIIHISTIINDTGSFIEQYAILVKEYHHLEHWLAVVITETAGLIKK